MIVRWRLGQPARPIETPAWVHLFRRDATAPEHQKEGRGEPERRATRDAREARASTIRIDAERHFFGLRDR